jgi:hypothetical protein
MQVHNINAETYCMRQMKYFPVQWRSSNHIHPEEKIITTQNVLIYGKTTRKSNIHEKLRIPGRQHVLLTDFTEPSPS